MKITAKGLADVCNAIGKFFSRNSQPILLGLTIAGAVGGTAVTVIGTVKSMKDVSDYREELANIDDSFEEAQQVLPASFDEGARQTCRRKAKLRLIFRIAKRALLVGIILAMTIWSATKQVSNANARYARLASAYSALAASFADYREEVRSRYGANVENDIHYGQKNQNLLHTPPEERGELTGPYELIFDERSPLFSTAESHPDWRMQNAVVWRQVTTWAQDQVNTRKYGLDANDLLDAFGLPRERALIGLCWPKGTIIDFKMNDLNDGAFIDVVDGFPTYYRFNLEQLLPEQTVYY